MFSQAAVLCWAISAVLAAPTDVVPLEKQQPTVIPIVSQSEELEPNGTYKYSYETGNGIKREETSFDKIIPKVRGNSDVSSEGGGSDESDEIHVQQGSYSYTAPDGTVITVRYIADENGFQAFGDHLPRAPTVQQFSSSSADKSGRALKSLDSAETASAPVPAIKSEPVSIPVKPAPEAVQSAADAKPESSEPSSIPAVPAENPSDIQSRSGAEVAASPEQTAPVDAIEQNSTPATFEPVTGAADQSPAAAEQSNVLAEATEDSTAAAGQSTVADEQSPAAEQPTVAAEQSTVAAELSTVAAEQSTVAAEQSTVAAEQSTVAAEQSTVAAEQSTVAAEQSSTAAAEEISTKAAEQPAGGLGESTTAAGSVEPSTAAVEDQSSTVADAQSTPVSSESQPSVTAATEELVSVNAEAANEVTEQSASVPESEQPLSTEATLQFGDAVSTTVLV